MSDRTHEECCECLFQKIEPSPCGDGHPEGPVACPHRQRFMKLIYGTFPKVEDLEREIVLRKRFAKKILTERDILAEENRNFLLKFDLVREVYNDWDRYANSASMDERNSDLISCVSRIRWALNFHE